MATQPLPYWGIGVRILTSTWDGAGQGLQAEKDASMVMLTPCSGFNILPTENK